MAGNSFGQIFRITTFGESHGVAIGVVIDGCPSNFEIDLDEIQHQLNRRKPGQSAITTQRKEDDSFEVLSGLFEGKTTGAPICIIIRNKDARPGDYDNLKNVFRPSHADYTYHEKYGIRDHRGGGRSSARETAARVIAGSIARQLLLKNGITITAFVSQTGEISLNKNYSELDLNKVDNNIVRCPDAETAHAMETYITELKITGDSCGGIITCIIKGMPAGLGEPVFDKLNADLAKAVMSVNAAHGFEFGSGFAGAAMKGSNHNDIPVSDILNRVAFKSNNSGGIQGGISNGADIFFRVAFKPVATILSEQQTINTKGSEVTIAAKGRHDPCVVPRAVPIVEAMAAITILDHILRNRTTRV